MEMQEQQAKSQVYATPINQFGSSILILTNPDDVLHQKELMLRGLALDKDNNYIQIGPPLMNEAGINELITTTKSLISRNANMSNLEDIEEVDRIRDHYASNIIQTLMVSRVKFQIKDPEVTRSLIVNDFVVAVHMSLKRAYREGDKRFLGKTTQEVNQTLNAGQTKSKGLLGSILGWQ